MSFRRLRNKQILGIAGLMLVVSIGFNFWMLWKHDAKPADPVHYVYPVDSGFAINLDGRAGDMRIGTIYPNIPMGGATRFSVGSEYHRFHSIIVHADTVWLDSSTVVRFLH